MTDSNSVLDTVYILLNAGLKTERQISMEISISYEPNFEWRQNF